MQRNIFRVQKDTGRNGTAFGYILDMFKYISTISTGMVSYQIFLKCDLSLLCKEVSSISNLDKLCVVGWFLALRRTLAFDLVINFTLDIVFRTDFNDGDELMHCNCDSFFNEWPDVINIMRQK